MTNTSFICKTSKKSFPPINVFQPNGASQLNEGLNILMSSVQPPLFTYCLSDWALDHYNLPFNTQNRNLIQELLVRIFFIYLEFKFTLSIFKYDISISCNKLIWASPGTYVEKSYYLFQAKGIVMFVINIYVFFLYISLGLFIKMVVTNMVLNY